MPNHLAASGAGSAVKYLFRDTFGDSSPSGAQRTITGSLWTIVNQAMRGGSQVSAASPTWGNSKIVWTDTGGAGWARVNGRTFVTLFTPEDAASDIAIGWDTATTTTDVRTIGHGWLNENGNGCAIQPGLKATIDAGGRFHRPIQYLVGVTLFAEGAVVWLSTFAADSGNGMADQAGIPSYPNARIMWVEMSDTTATLYPYVSAYDCGNGATQYPNGHCLQDARGVDVASWNSADALANAIDRFTRANSTTSIGGSLTTVRGTWGINSNRAYLVAKAGGGWDGVWLPSSLSDGIFTWDITISASWSGTNTFAFGTFRWIDNNNYWRVGINNSNALQLQVFTGGGNPSATLASGSYTFAAGGRYRIILKAIGNKYQAWVVDLINNTISQPWGNTWQTDASNLHLIGTKIGLSGGGTALDNYYDNIAVYPLMFTLPAELRAGAKPVQFSAGNTLVSDTFTDTNGVNLTAHTPEIGGAYTAHAGTWPIQSNRATCTKAAGINQLTQDLGVKAIEISADVITPASFPTTTMRAGLVARRTSDNNEVHARLFKDSTQVGADEIELLEGNGSSTPIVHKINLGSKWAVSTTYNLKMQVGPDPNGGDDLVHVLLDGKPGLSYKLSQTNNGTRAGLHLDSIDDGAVFDTLLAKAL